MQSALQVMISGLQVGCIYALMALSFYVIQSATGILNFAQGEWLMISSVLGVVLLAFMPFAVAFILAVLLTTGLALLSERLVIRPLQKRNANLVTVILSLLGIMIVARYGTGLLFGQEEYPLPGLLGSDIIAIGDSVFLQPQTMVIYATTAIVFASVYIYMQRTWLGRSLRVAAIDPLGAALIGVDLQQVRTIAFGLGGLIAAITGWLYAPLYAAGYMVGIVPGVKGFVVMVIGGMASPLGSLIGGIALGLIEVASARYLSSLYSEAIGFVVLMGVLFVRPEGIIATAPRS
jgi:branched-chain amino acid transport system permease protein